MTYEELKKALVTKRPVLWRGGSEHEQTVGSVTAIITRNANGSDIVSAEITSYGARSSRVICRPEELSYWAVSDGMEGRTANESERA